MQHVILKNPRLKGWEYGMLRALEAEIISQTSASIVEVPEYGYDFITDRVAHGVRWSSGRTILPKKNFNIDADVIWYVLMGPENYELDLFKGWHQKAKYRIVYLFDTLEPQFELIKRLFSDNSFNICITSFSDAAPLLENLTGKKWNAVPQAIPEGLFSSTSPEERVIDFCSYGRRIDSFHQTLIEFCRSNGLYYDYTTHDRSKPTAPEEDLYRHYAWHLSHSKFAISWPVELTHPSRAGKLNPVTCRWFEAAAAGTVILGKKPENPEFENIIAPNVVIEMDPFADKATIWEKFEKIYADRNAYLVNAEIIRKENSWKWTWKARVQQMLKLINESASEIQLDTIAYV